VAKVISIPDKFIVNFVGYRYSAVNVPRGHVVMREVFWENNGTVSGVDEFTVENQARLYMWSLGNTGM
jgi:hypothetical protein